MDNKELKSKVININEQLSILNLLYVNTSMHLSIDDILNMFKKSTIERINLKINLEAMMSSGLISCEFFNHTLVYSLTNFGRYFYDRLQEEQTDFFVNEVIK